MMRFKDQECRFLEYKQSRMGLYSMEDPRLGEGGGTVVEIQERFGRY